MAGALHGVIASLAGRITDAFFRYVSLLLNTTSTNGAQNNTFLDSSTNNFSITRNGNTTQGTFSPFSQTGWSNFFDGTGDQLNLSVSAISGVGSSNFSIECWVYAQRQTNTFVQGLVSYGIAGSSTGTSYLSFELTAAGNLSVAYAQAATSTLTDSTLFPINQWVHAVVCRSGSTISLFVNGSRVATATTSATVGSTGDTLALGGQWFANVNTRQLQGYISNARIVNGTSAYDATLTTLTVPTTPLTNITNTSLLTCQSNRFIDNSSNAFAITRNGDVSVQAFSPFNPTAAWSASTNGGSGYFDGTGDYLTIADNAAFEFASGDLTAEAWIYITGYSSVSTSVIFAKNSDISNLGFYLLLSGTTSSFTTISWYQYYSGTTAEISNGSFTFALNTWYHVAATKSGGNVRIFVNGTQVNTTAAFTQSQSNSAAPVSVGGQPFVSNNYFFTGYISSARLVKGTAVYTSNFTPPTAPLTAITNTSLLCNFTNAGIFDSASGNDLETVGNAQVSTTVAKWGTTSMAFDGTGDWLLNIDKPALRLGTAAFTIEMWVYRSASGTYGLVSKGTSTTGWSVSLNASNQVVFSFAASSFNSTGTVTATTWTHIAVVREGTGSNQTKIYINGTNDGTGTVSTDFNQTNAMYVGADRVAGGAFNGYIDDLRITNGYARYTSNFTAPTAAFPLN